MNQASALPRRPLLGLELGDDLVVARVDAAGTASSAGVLRSDVLVALNGVALRDGGHLVERARELIVGSPVIFSVLRDGVRLDLTAPAIALPLESIDGGVVELSHVRVGQHRLRTIVTTPSAAPPLDAAILYLQGLDCASCEHPLEPQHPESALLAELTRSGLCTMRIERRGVGDSEGPPCRDTTLDDELAMARAAINELRKRSERVFLFGHSVGGMIAPLVARGGVAGVIVFGTSPMRWHDCIVGTTARQRALAGLAVDPRWTALHAAICCEGLTPEEAFARDPRLRALESADCRGRYLFGRHASFFQKLQRIELLDAWRSIVAPTLALHGEYDFVCTEGDAASIAEATRGEHVELPKIGHDGRAHESLHAAFRDPGAGTPSDAIAEATLSFVRALLPHKLAESLKP